MECGNVHVRLHTRKHYINLLQRGRAYVLETLVCRRVREGLNIHAHAPSARRFHIGSMALKLQRQKLVSSNHEQLILLVVQLDPDLREM